MLTNLGFLVTFIYKREKINKGGNMNFNDDNMSQQEYEKTISELPVKREVPEFPGRPNRGVIKNQDIIDLKIAMNTAKSLEAFLAMV